jgi:hypothetical protein
MLSNFEEDRLINQEIDFFAVPLSIGNFHYTTVERVCIVVGIAGVVKFLDGSIFLLIKYCVFILVRLRAKIVNLYCVDSTQQEQF